jgi:hypothetical protein
MRTARPQCLPDDIFSYQKSKFGYVFEDIDVENVGILSPLEYILRPFGTIICLLGNFAVIWYTFSPILVHCTK